MLPRRPIVSRRDTLLSALLALGLSAAVVGALGLVRGRWPDVPQRPHIVLTLDTAVERPEARYLMSVIPLPAVEHRVETRPPIPPPPSDTNPAPPPDVVPDAFCFDAETLKELEREREDLKARLARAQAEADLAAERAVLRAMAGRARALDVAAGPKGTIRELDLSGHPQAVIDRVMQRHRLRVSRQVLTGPAEQNFLSSADARGERFYANTYSSPGVYEVFELSPEAVAHMSRLEEAEIKRRNLNLETTKVSRVVFGIVPSPGGDHDLGLLEFQAQALE